MASASAVVSSSPNVLEWKYEETLLYKLAGEERFEKIAKWHDSKSHQVLSVFYNWILVVLLYLCLYQVIVSVGLMAFCVAFTCSMTVLHVAIHADLFLAYLLLKQGEGLLVNVVALAANVCLGFALNWDYRAILLLLQWSIAYAQLSIADSFPNIIRLGTLLPSYFITFLIALVTCLSISFGWLPGIDETAGFNLGNFNGLSNKNVFFPYAALAANYYFSLAIYSLFKFIKAIYANRENHLLNLSAPISLKETTNLTFLHWAENRNTNNNNV